jgi:GTPase
MKPAKPQTPQSKESTRQEPTSEGGVRASVAHDDTGDNTLFDQVKAVQVGARALLLHPYLKKATTRRSPESALSELVSLSGAIDLQAIDIQYCPLATIRSATYMGQGKVDELALQVEAQDIEVVIVNCALSPVQQSNLEQALKTKVIDRTALILEIFGARAQTREGVMQVQLAHLSYQRGRLVRSWTHLERQRGGSGFMGGPGERQIESDRRALDDSIGRLTKQLEKVTRTRDLHRKGRQKMPYPIVALVGYTNAGKSTLFNRLTHADVYAKDQLFATLDPTMRSITLKSGRKIILSDTVGFISDLPTHLIAAFRATLEEVIQADIILHIRDISHAETNEQQQDVLEVLDDLGLKDHSANKLVEVHNKIDLLDQDVPVDSAYGSPSAPIPFCALDGRGEDALMDRIDQILAIGSHDVTVKITHEQGDALAWLYRHSDVLNRADSEEGSELKVRLTQASLGRLQKMNDIEILAD